MRDPDEYDPTYQAFLDAEPEPPWCRTCGEGSDGCPECDPQEPPELVLTTAEHICCTCHAFKPGCCNAGHAAWVMAERAVGSA